MFSKITPAIVSALGLAQLASAQGQGNPIPIPAVTAGGQQGAADCQGCYVVADVAGIAFGTETVQAVETQGVIVQPGLNGTYTTTTTIGFGGVGQFTFGPSGLAAAPAPTGGAGTAYNTDGTTLVISGVTLTSPTAYNVFTAYSVTSRVFSNGACSVVAGSSINLGGSAFSVVIPQGVNPADYAQAAQQSFVDHIGRPSCSLGGIDYTATTAIPVNVSTTQITTTNSARMTPQPVSISTAATTTGPTGTFIPLSGFNGTSTAYLPGGTGTIVIPFTGRTITQAAGAARNSVVGSFFGGVVAFIAGMVA